MHVISLFNSVRGRDEDWGTLPEDKLASPGKETKPDLEDLTYSRRTKRPNGKGCLGKPWVRE